MIETIMLQAFQTLATAYMEEPENPPATYLTLRKIAGGRVNHIRTATIAVLSYGPTLEDAAALNERVVQLADGLGPGDGVFRVELNSDYEYTNLETKQYRYQAVLEVYY